MKKLIQRRKKDKSSVSVPDQLSTSVLSEGAIKVFKETREALLNILEDVEEERKRAEEERDKTMAIFQNFPEALCFLITITPYLQLILRLSNSSELHRKE